MQNKTLIIVIALIIIVAGFLGYSKLAGKTSTNPSVTIQNDQNKTEGAVTGTIKGLLEKGLTQKCTITYPDNEGTGTMYLSGRKFSSEFTMNVGEGQKITGYSVSDGNYIYIWSNASTTGTKMKIDTALENAPTGTDTTQGGNLNEELKFNCSGWTLDQAKFTPPSNIQFNDLTNLLPKTTTSPQTSEEKAGNSICDMITDPTAKTACLDAVKNAGQ